MLNWMDARLSILANLKRITVRNYTRSDIRGSISSDEGEEPIILSSGCEMMLPVGEILTLATASYFDGEPIPVHIYCPKCGALHVDTGEFATKPHHTHSCQHCGLTWRPAVVNTVGVRFLPGFKNKDGT